MRALAAIWHFITAFKNAVGNLLFLLLIVVLVVALWTEDSVSVPSDSALILNPTGLIVEQETRIDPVAEFLSGYEDEAQETLLRDLQDAMAGAATDPRIKLLVLDLTRLRGASMSALEDLGSAVRQFRESGKPVYAYAQSYNQTQYFIAAHADSVFLDQDAFSPLGGVFLTGLGLYPTYFKSALDSLKVSYHVFKAGLFKGAVEPYTRDDMSPESVQANQALIDVLWRQLRAVIAEHRKLDPAAVDRYLEDYDRLLAAVDGNGGELALQQRFVDELLTREQWLSRVREHVAPLEESFAHIGFRDYLAITRPPIPALAASSAKIAVITGSGTILDGEQPPGTIGSETMIELIRQARQDDSIKALVLRIDSPGGSASAAELIRRELRKTRDAGKPVVISMAGYAASGGYWIASAGNRIFARATTVTGSIGAFMMFPTFEQSLAELGIYSDGVGTHELSGSLSAFRPLNPVLERTLETTIDATYRRFLAVVAESRDMTTAEVDQVAQGRVWAGLTAVDLGLVDSVGDLDDAIESASLLASLTDFEVLHLEQHLNTRDALIKELLRNALVLVHKATGGVGQFSEFSRVARAIPTDLRVLLDRHQPTVLSQCLDCRVSP